MWKAIQTGSGSHIPKQELKIQARGADRYQLYLLHQNFGYILFERFGDTGSTLKGTSNNSGSAKGAT